MMKYLIAAFVGAAIGSGVTLVIWHDTNLLSAMREAEAPVQSPIALSWASGDCVRMDPITGNIEENAPCLISVPPLPGHRHKERK